MIGCKPLPVRSASHAGMEEGRLGYDSDGSRHRAWQKLVNWVLSGFDGNVDETQTRRWRWR